MTGPGAGSASRMRIAGIVLLAVAAVAAVVGLVALGSQGPSSQNTALPVTAAPAPAAPMPGSVPSGQPPASGGPQAAGLPPSGVGAPGAPGAPAAPAAPSPAPAGGPVVAAPIVPPAEPAAPAGGSAGGSGGSAGSGTGSTAVPVRVLNNSMITGLAERAAADLRMRGWNVVEVGNYPSGVIPVSTVYFRPGTDEEGAAQTVAAQTGIRSEPRFPGIQGASPGLIVIATNNWGQTAPKL